MSPRRITLVLAAMDSCREIQDVLSHLERQTIRDQVEIIIVCRSRDQLDDRTGLLEEDEGLRVIEGGTEIEIHDARALGVRASRCEYVATMEDHCFPEPQWAAAMLSRLEEGWTGVGSVFCPANPQTAIAQAMHLVCYGQWLAPARSREVAYIAGNNCAYRRDVLVARGNRLPLDLAVPSAMQVELREQGQRLFVDAAALVRHWDCSVWRGVPTTFFALGRVIGYRRAMQWGRVRRVLMALAVPALAVLRWFRAVTPWWREKKRYRFSWGMPLWAAIMVLHWSAVEGWSYLFGSATSLLKGGDIEHDRQRFLREGEWPHPDTSYSVESNG